MFNRLKLYFVSCCLFSLTFSLFSIEFKGILLDEITNEPVSFATIAILEIKKKIRTNEKGTFFVDLDSNKNYTFLFRSSVHKLKRMTFNINEATYKQILLTPLTFKSNTIQIVVSKDKQQLGRQTLKQKEIKTTPTALGDALSVATSLPGITQGNGFISAGGLILRGIDNLGNRYFIDGIPILYPQHFAALQFIISNEMISTLDIYSSSAPVHLGQFYGGAIAVNTIDEVKKERFKIDVSLLYISFYGEGLLEKNINCTPQVKTKHAKAQPNTECKPQKKQWGYWSTALRLGYLGFTALPLVRLITKDDSIPTPQYGDYQFKLKFLLDDHGVHSIKLLLIGTFDYLSLTQNRSSTNQVEALTQEGLNPFLIGNNTLTSFTLSNIQSLYYVYKPSEKLNNTLHFYNIINYISSDTAVSAAANSGVDVEQNINSIPNIAALQNTTDWNIFRKSAISNINLQLALGYELYNFTSSGKTQIPTAPIRTNRNAAQPTPAELRNSRAVNLDITTASHLLFTYLNLNFNYYGFFSKIGSRFDYLTKGNHWVFSPRTLFGYKFHTETSISTAAGIYNSFPQINFAYFNNTFTPQGQIVNIPSLKPETSYQFALGLEQKFLKVSFFKIEAFYNILTNLVENTFQPNLDYTNSGSGRNYGTEVSFQFAFEKPLKINPKKKIQIKALRFLSWLSYTYTKAERKGNQTNGQFISFDNEQEHSFKLTTGVELIEKNQMKHQLGFKFELSSGFPYTPIVDSAPDSITIDGQPYTYYNPVYGDVNSRNYPLFHRLDFRYTFTKQYKKFTFSFYLGIINLYYFQSANQIFWKYNMPFSDANPSFRSNLIIPIIPVFGFEFDF